MDLIDHGQRGSLRGGRYGLWGFAHLETNGEHVDLALSPDEAARRLREAVDADPYTAALWSALVSDAAISGDGNRAEPTPLCLMFGNYIQK